MIKHLRNAVRNPLVIAYTALTLALTGGGAAYAVATIGSADIIDGSIQSVDLKNKNVKQADLQPAEKWHEVGATGEPGFPDQTVQDGGAELHQAHWRSETFGGIHETAGFYRDPFGTVHLKGTVCQMVTQLGPGCIQYIFVAPQEYVIFTLPPGYRPAAKVVYSMSGGGGSTRVDVRANGDVITQRDQYESWLALDGVTFRCAPSGSNGCP